MEHNAVAIGGRDVLAIEKKNAGVNYAQLLTHICERMGVTHLLSYGFGTKWLFRHLKVKNPIKLQRFEPGVDTPAVPAQFVVCLDVLGYDDEAQTLDDLERLTEAVLFVNIHTTADKPISYWLPKFWDRFEFHNAQVVAADEFYVICYAKSRIETQSAPGRIVRVHSDPGSEM
jgi:hypothetical protein